MPSYELMTDPAANKKVLEQRNGRTYCNETHIQFPQHKNQYKKPSYTKVTITTN